MEARLPREKHVKAIELVNEALRRTSLTRHELDSLVGFLSFASRVIPASCPFPTSPLRRTGYPQPSATQAITRHTPIKGAVKHNLLNGTAYASTTHRVPATLSHAGYRAKPIKGTVKRDLKWWQEFLRPQWNGIRLLQPSRLQAYLWTDAPGTKGIGGYFLLDRALLPQRAQVFSRMVPQRHKKKHINYKEMFAALQALQLWLASFAGRQVHVYCDNDAVVAALRKQTIRGNAISPLRKIAMIAALHDVQRTIHWTPTAENTLADALSPLQKIAMIAALHDVQRTIHWTPTAENALADALSRWDWACIANMCPHLQAQDLPALLQ
jgi:ribonuclease HI